MAVAAFTCSTWQQKLRLQQDRVCLPVPNCSLQALQRVTEERAVTCTLTPSFWLYSSASWLSPPFPLRRFFLSPAFPACAARSFSARLDWVLVAVHRASFATSPLPDLRSLVLREPQQEPGDPSAEGVTTLTSDTRSNTKPLRLAQR